MVVRQHNPTRSSRQGLAKRYSRHSMLERKMVVVGMHGGNAAGRKDVC
jgi:hypothetical protein